MNILFFVEGTNEKRIFREWITYITPLTCDPHPTDVTDNNFVIIGNIGNPPKISIIEGEFTSETISKFDHVIISIDLDTTDITCMQKKQNLIDDVNEKCSNIDAEIHYVIQCHCLESWLLGYKKVDLDGVDDPLLISYRDHYNVNNLDPENITPYRNFNKQTFSMEYVKKMLLEGVPPIIYTKRSTWGVERKAFFDDLRLRYRGTNHIASFNHFFEKIQSICT